VPIPEEAALDSAELEDALARALDEADRERITGAAVTPFILGRISAVTEGRSVPANLALAEHNAAVAAAVATAIAGHR
jgi:pseudouridine-5'-phosphate glycosidase